jgi:hypothetical protein
MWWLSRVRMARSVLKSASSAELENANTARPCATGALTVNARFIDRRNCRSCGFTPPFSLRFQATRSLILASLQQIVCADFCTDPHRCGLGSSLRHHAEFQPLHGPSERSTLHTHCELDRDSIRQNFWSDGLSSAETGLVATYRFRYLANGGNLCDLDPVALRDDSHSSEL